MHQTGKLTLKIKLQTSFRDSPWLARYTEMKGHYWDFNRAGWKRNGLQPWRLEYWIPIIPAIAMYSSLALLQLTGQCRQMYKNPHRRVFCRQTTTHDYLDRQLSAACITPCGVNCIVHWRQTMYTQRWTISTNALVIDQKWRKHDPWSYSRSLARSGFVAMYILGPFLKTAMGKQFVVVMRDGYSTIKRH